MPSEDPGEGRRPSPTPPEQPGEARRPVKTAFLHPICSIWRERKEATPPLPGPNEPSHPFNRNLVCVFIRKIHAPGVERSGYRDSTAAEQEKLFEWVKICDSL